MDKEKIKAHALEISKELEKANPYIKVEIDSKSVKITETVESFPYKIKNSWRTSGGEEKNMEKYSTSDLSEELSGREGVTSLEAAPYEKIKITVGTKEIEVLGPAVIIVNQD